LKSCGYEINPEVIKYYCNVVKRMTREARSEIFFLKANDSLFKPHACKVGDSIVTQLTNRQKKHLKFTDIPLDGKKGYFIIAAPST